MIKTKQELCNELMLEDSNKAMWHFEEEYTDELMEDIDDFQIFKNNTLIVDWYDYEGYDITNTNILSKDEVYILTRWLDENKNFFIYSEKTIKEERGDE